MKRWMMIQSFTALNTVYRKTPEKQATCRTPFGTEKQSDYILVDKKHIFCSTDAEANDMIHMGRDHRSVMAQFGITAPKKVSQKTHCDSKKTKTAQNTKRQSDDKTRSCEAIKFEERYAELERKIKYKTKIAATTQKPKMIESLTKSKQAERVVDTGITVLPHCNEDTKHCSYSEDEIGKTCCGS